jgi:hypothetical protein
VDGVPKDILTSVLTTVVLAALTSILLIFTRIGRSAWNAWGQTDGLRPIAVVAIAGLLIGLGVLSAIFFYYRITPEAQQLIAAEWDENKISFTSKGANVTAQILMVPGVPAPGVIRVKYDSYNFFDNPMIIISGTREAPAWAHNITNRYVDVREQNYGDFGQWNGAEATDKRFSILIIPPVKPQ